jgi:hypothetical protein
MRKTGQKTLKTTLYGILLLNMDMGGQQPALEQEELPYPAEVASLPL